ncbi:hypothetical protein PC110_g12769 [Phytophthora cactorum]|nr:hypothetical protein PC110_g12769 [Phytophthora cactorum]
MSIMREAYPDAIPNIGGRVPAISIIKHTRNQITGSDDLRAVESTPTRTVALDDPRPFLQLSLVHTDGCGQRKFLGFEHPDLIRLLRYTGTAFFIGGTFKMVPKPFSQYLILMWTSTFQRYTC